MSPVFQISGPSLPPAAGGSPRELVILLHGVGADGDDLIELAPHWAPLLPHAEFLAPNAPFPCDMAPFGCQWFSLQDRQPERMLAGIRVTAPLLDAYIDQALAERDLTDARLALVGFSQGTMMALHVAPRRPRPCAAVIGYSGALLGADLLPLEIRSRPPVLLVHGDADDVVPVSVLPTAAAALESAGIAVEAVVRPDLGHGIDPEGLALGGAYLQRAFAA